ncbi:MAG: glucosamine 6-phosphate synthetase [Pseudomonadota bacterium]|nr:glucosamine 6-phosphate synthetase [Pseudomonadota bacterium]MEC8168915.1 glucosamine 6-phosphate synthetase [Pseudomonadota bacterium]MEC8378602.1 glucosamine 6-phosphate synthetase [Pseudomonadota bacterium]
MCGIFGIISEKKVDLNSFKKLALLSERRGRDSSGLLFFETDTYKILKADYRCKNLLKEISDLQTQCIIGHSRLITNSQLDNQPVHRNGISIIHNGIILDDDLYWQSSSLSPEYKIDTEVLLAITLEHLNEQGSLEGLYEKFLEQSKGAFSCCLTFPKLGKLVLLSNTGSLYYSESDKKVIFASEKYFLSAMNQKKIHQLKGMKSFDIPISEESVLIDERKIVRDNLVPSLPKETLLEKKLLFEVPNLKRCTKCILPETMPFIKFNSEGVCNYCENYTPRNKPKDKDELLNLLKSYEKFSGKKCIVPLSGGRDSSYALHVIKKELKMSPITMTYDWGMVTDLARRNISRMCSQLGVENIIIADNISKKRSNIKKNLLAWLKKPDLGMLNILMAGDKHFFRHIESIKKELGVSLNIWGMNPLEVTHFKAGFLGYVPDFETKQVFYTGLSSQLRYQFLRAIAMLKNPSYLNSSLWDTLSGEYYRSVKTQKDFYNAYDFWQWDENLINESLKEYEWETAVDTKSTWRIGDGTAAFYNYVYFTMAGFSEFDTFRSNQIREGQLSRSQALEYVNEENAPRYQNIKWYLDAIGMDFEKVVETINLNHKKYYPT